ncbi:MAG: hypothetical protein IJU72_08180 [Bacteroidales bacterium]|nr:hypothetical protein [Bacteroidales bacterium]
MKTPLIIPSSLFLLLMLIATPLCAQDFEVAPVVLEFDAEPATNQVKTLNVKNHSSKPLAFIVSMADFLPSQDGQNEVQPAGSSKNSCANWLTVNPSFFEIAPGGDIALQVNMLVPGEELKTAWCMLYLQPTREQTSWGADRELSTGVVVSGRIGVHIFQSPKSLRNHSIKVSNFHEVYQGGPSRQFAAVLENMGDCITPCKIFMMLSRLDGAVDNAADQRIDVGQMVVFPKMSRSVNMVLPDNIAPGIYSLALLADYGPRYPLEGAQLQLVVK